MLKKFTSRKFLICLAAFLASVATSISGLHIDNAYVVSIGLICGVLSAGIYAAVEASVDAEAIKKVAEDDKKE